jgi:hypothetical protein
VQSLQRVQAACWNVGSPKRGKGVVQGIVSSHVLPGRVEMLRRKAWARSVGQRRYRASWLTWRGGNECGQLGELGGEWRCVSNCIRWQMSGKQ